MDLAKIPDFSCNLQNPPTRKFRAEKEDMSGKIRTYGSPTFAYTNATSTELISGAKSPQWVHQKSTNQLTS